MPSSSSSLHSLQRSSPPSSPAHGRSKQRTFPSATASLGSPRVLTRGHHRHTSSLIRSTQACRERKDIARAREIHGEALERGLLPNDANVSTAVLSMLLACGAIAEAEEVFREISVKDVVSWTALIHGYAKHGLPAEALEGFVRMRAEGVCPNAVTFICVLKACGILRCLSLGAGIHAEVVKFGILADDSMLGNALIDMYAKCGALVEAQKVFDELPTQDIVSWNTLVGGYVRHGLAREGIKCFRQMQVQGILPDSVTLLCVLKACGSIGCFDLVEEIETHVKDAKLMAKDYILLGTALVDMYAKLGAMEKAQQVFEALPMRDVVVWNALISGYVEHGHGHEALRRFKQMRTDDKIAPNRVTFLSALKACGSIRCLETAEEMHGEVKKKKWLRNEDVLIGSALVDMYGKCGKLDKARDVFEGLPVRTVVSWTTLIAGYTEHEHNREAVKCFRQMQSEGISPDILTYVCVLKACGNIGCLEIGEEIHAEVRKLGLLRNNTVLGNALIDMYSKCGVLEKAMALFEELPVQDTVSWNALISGYIRHGFCDEAIRCFRKMQTKGISPDPVTFIYILKACGTVGCLEMGESIHTQLRNGGFLGKDHVQLDTALVDMYGKCGMPEKAQEVFQELCRHDIIGWNALISGYSQVGKVRKVLGSFQEMSAEGIPTDRVTSLVLLSTCSHEGLMKEGKILFGEMCSVYDLDAMLDHCVCMLDLLGRAGCFHEAAHMLEKMPSSNHLPLLLSILGACKTWANVNLGEWAFLRILDLDPMRSEAYVCMGNIYAAAGMQMEGRWTKFEG